jgi:hypothetical protein
MLKWWYCEDVVVAYCNVHYFCAIIWRGHYRVRALSDTDRLLQSLTGNIRYRLLVDLPLVWFMKSRINRHCTAFLSPTDACWILYLWTSNKMSLSALPVIYKEMSLGLGVCYKIWNDIVDWIHVHYIGCMQARKAKYVHVTYHRCAFA